MKAKLPRVRYEMSRQQEEAMNEEIHRQILLADKQYSVNYDAMVLYAIHKHFGFGKKRLKSFFDEFNKIHNELLTYYEMPKEDNGWLCIKELERIGIDIYEWEKEAEGKENEKTDLC